MRFRTLTPAELSEIVKIQLSQLSSRLANLHITPKISQAAESWLASRGYDPEFGARPLRRVLQRELSDKLAVLLLEGVYNAGDAVEIDVENDRISFH